MIKAEKNTVEISSGVEPPMNPVPSWSRPPTMRTAPVTMMDSHMNGVMIFASCDTGVRFMRPAWGASEQSAKAARVSMMILIQRIWMMVKGSGYPRSGAMKTRMQAQKLMVSWKRMNRWIFSYSDRPHQTALVIDEK